MVCAQQGVASSSIVKEFEIRVAGFKIGELTAIQNQVNDSVTQFTLKSTVNFWLFYRIDVTYSNISTFLNGKLISSFVKTVANKKEYQSTSLWKKDHYQIEVDTYGYKKDTTLLAPIRFNIAKMFFTEPDNQTMIFADNYGLLAKAEYIDEKYYVVEVLGQRNKYFYHEGVLEKTLKVNAIKNYEVKLVEEVK